MVGKEIQQMWGKAIPGCTKVAYKSTLLIKDWKKAMVDGTEKVRIMKTKMKKNV